MTRDDIIRMAREAGFESHDAIINYPKELQRFAAIVAAAECEWQGLTDEDIRKLSDDCAGVRDETEFIRAIEAKLKEKNGY